MPLDELPLLSPEDRRLELLRILARGLLRLCQRGPRGLVLPPDLGPKNLAESRVNCLEVAPDFVLIVSRRVDGPRGPTESPRPCRSITRSPSRRRGPTRCGAPSTRL